MTKIKSRKEKLKEYNEKYPEKDLTKLITNFISDRKDIDAFSQECAELEKKILDARETCTIKITMYEFPMKYHRVRVLRSGRSYSPNAAENKLYFDEHLKFIRDKINLINTPAEILIKAYLEMPKGISDAEAIMYEMGILKPLVTPDYDNIAKAYADALKDTLITDDDIFYKGTVIKQYSLLPRVELSIKFQKRHDSKYVYEKIMKRKSVKQGIKDGVILIETIFDD